MANIITMNSPGPPEYLQGFIDRFNQGRKDEEEASYRKQQLANQSRMAGVAEGGLNVEKDRYGLDRDKFAAEQRLENAKSLLSEIKRLKEVGDIPGAQKVLQAGLAQDPSLEKMNLNMLLSGGATDADRANANSAKFDASQTGIAAGGGTDPNAVNYTTRRNLKADMPAYGYEQQQAADLAAKGGPPISKFERRATGDLTTAGQDQVAATNIKATGMQTASAERQNTARIEGENTRAKESSGKVGQYVREVDQNGNVKGYFNPKTGDRQGPGFEDARSKEVGYEERKDATTLEGMLSDSNRLRALAKKHIDVIGKVRGPIIDVLRKYSEQDPEISEMFQIASSLTNQRIYMMSGKQINEAEAKRLSGINPSLATSVNDFYTRLNRFDTEMSRLGKRNTATQSTRKPVTNSNDPLGLFD